MKRRGDGAWFISTAYLDIWSLSRGIFFAGRKRKANVISNSLQEKAAGKKCIHDKDTKEAIFYAQMSGNNKVMEAFFSLSPLLSS